MTAFETAYNKVMDYEGGYSFDNDDPGGETYKGISRVHNPHWAGWQIVDAYKSRSDFPFCLDSDRDLLHFVRAIYKKKYWDVYLGDQLEPEIAEEMFDQAVNFGEPVAIIHFQRALNILNNREKLYANIIVDGKFGGKTFTAYLECIKRGRGRLLFNVLNFYQGKRYIELMELNEVKEKYIGWFDRIEIKRL